MATGFLSRILLIYGEPTGERITFPTDATQEVKEPLRKSCRRLNSKSAVVHRRIQKLIQCSMRFINNERFTGYTIQDLFKRRFTQLIKIILSVTASYKTNRINSRIVKEANTYLAAAEHLMSKALGEFGKGNMEISLTGFLV